MIGLGVGSLFVARTAELAALAGAYRQARDEGPAVVLIGGEAGIGKSRLVAEFTAGLAPDARVIEGACLELSGEGLPYAPFVTAMRRLVRDLDSGNGPVGQLLPGGGRRGLAHWLPELGEPEGEQDQAYGRALLFGDILALIEGAAKDRPLVLVLEDLHWADLSSRELLLYLVHNLNRPGVLVIGTYRSTDLDDAHPLRSLLASLTRLGSVSRIEPARLTRTEVRELLAARLGRTPESALVADIHRRSDGNPLFVEAMADAGPAALSATPAALRDLLLAGFRDLPEDSRELVHAAAVAGGQVGHALLAAVTGFDDLTLEAGVRPAVRRRLLVPTEDGYAFRHALVRAAVYEELLPSERVRWHGRCARALRDDPALVPIGRASVELAAHWYAAGDREQAFDAAWSAAETARSAYAYGERLCILERVLLLWDQVSGPEQRIGVSRPAVLRAAGEACLDAGRAERGIALATEALRAPWDPEHAALILQTRSLLKHRLGLDGLDDLREAVLLAPPTAPNTRGRLLATLASRLEVLFRDPAAGDQATEALRLGRATDDAALQALALVTLASRASRDGAPQTAYALAGQAAELATGAGDHDTVLLATVTAAVASKAAGAYEQASEVTQRGIAIARRFGLAHNRGAVLAAVHADALVALGRWAPAREVLVETLALDPPPLYRAVLLTCLGTIAVAEGDQPAAAEAAGTAAELLGERYPGHEFLLPLRDLQCQVAVAAGSLTEADQLLAQALTDAGLPSVPGLARGPGLAGGPDLAGGSGLPGGSGLAGGPGLAAADVRAHADLYWPLLFTGARICQARLASAARDRQASAAIAQRVAQLRALGEILSSDAPVQTGYRLTFLAELDADLPAWDAAAGAWRDLTHPYPLAHALSRAAEAALAGGDKAGAQRRLREAESIARALGAAPLHREIEQIATRGRLSLDAPGPDSAGAGLFGLTPRETEVLRLVTHGRSNRQIGMELFISAKTAGVHVSNILAKLGVTSRTEAAAVAHRARLFDETA
jgi:DNA-binding CsgD family transcriptional regulator/tetratricopeptide (TPR) repeat protein